MNMNARQETWRIESWLWIVQRASAAVLALCVLVHLATIIFATRGSLSAAEILSRTQGSLGWGLFYGMFVVAVALHTPIGLRNIFAEWLAWRGRSLDVAMLSFAFLLAVLGFRAVAGVLL